MQNQIKDLMQHKNKILEIKKISDGADTIEHIRELERN